MGAANSTFAIGESLCSLDSFQVKESSGLLTSTVLKCPPTTNRRDVLLNYCTPIGTAVLI